MDRRTTGKSWRWGRNEHVPERRRVKARYVPWAVLAVMLALTYQLWKGAERNVLRVRQADFDFRVRDVSDRIQQRMSSYEQVLHGTRAFFINQRRTDHHEFRGYVAALQLAERFPGMQQVSYVPLVHEGQRQAHERAMRKDGLPGYAIRPAGIHDSYAPIAYLEPYQRQYQHLLGFDLLSDVRSRGTLERARDTGAAILSGAVVPLQAKSEATLLMALPVYQPGTSDDTLGARRAHLAGWMTAAFRMQELMDGMLGAEASDLDVEIYDGELAEQNMLFDSDHGLSRGESHLFQTVVALQVNGRPWRVAVHSLPAFERGMDRSRAYFTAGAGIWMSLLLAAITWLLVRDRSRALQTAAGASSELRERRQLQQALEENERRWKLALEAAGHGVWDWDLRTDEVACTDLAKQMRGYTAEDFPYRYFSDWGKGIHPDDLPKVQTAIQQHLAGETPSFILEYRGLCKNGEWKWLITRGMVVERDAEGKPLRMIGTHTDISERRALHAALQESEQRWRFALEGAGDGVLDWDIRSGRVTFSQRATEMLGYTLEELDKGHEVLMTEYVHPEDLPGAQAAMADYLTGKAAHYSNERRVRCKDGSWKWMLVRAMAVERDLQGKPLRLIGTQTDISERRAMEDALRENEQRWRFALEGAGDGVWDWDLRTDHVTYSRRFEEMLGYAPGELEADHDEVLKRIHPDDMPAVREATRAYLEGRAPDYVNERRVRCKDGSWKWVASRGMVVERDTDGKPLRMIGTHTDISERMRAEAALRESEEKYRSFFDNLSDLAFVTTLDWHFTEASEALLHVTGYTREELIGAHVSKILTTQNFEYSMKMAERKLVDGRPVTRYEMEITSRDGRQVPVEVVSTLIYKDGIAIGVQGMGRDISERRRAEAALRESEEQYRSVFEGAQDFYFAVDNSGRVTALTNHACEITGYTPEEVIGQPMAKLYSPENLEKVRKMIAAKIEGRVQTTSYEVELIAKDGHTVPVELHSMLRYKDGRVVGSHGIGRDISERRNFEQALRESEERYREFFEFANDFAYSTDAGQHFIAVNNSLLESTGYTRKELLGQHVSILLSPENLRIAAAMTEAKLLGNQHITRYEIELTTKDGRQLPIELVSSLIYKNGKFAGVQGIGRDIAERKRAEEALQRSERNYRELMEQAADAIFVADHEANRYVDVNRAGCELLGYTRAELLQLGPRDLLDPEELRLEPAKFDAIKAGQTVHTERHLLRKDGSKVWVEMTISMLADGRMMSVKRDITERKRAEEALQRSERNYRELMEQASEAICIYDQNLRCVDVNGAAQELFGYTRAEFQSFGMRDLVHPDDLQLLASEAEQQKLRWMLEGKITITGERRMRRKDGSYITVQISAKRLSDGRILSFKKDISDWRMREEALKQANLAAEAASRAKSEFLANMSHEIRTPMNSVIGMARLAMMHNPEQIQRGYLEKILLSGEHLLGIIDDILDFSKIDAGKLRIEKTRLDMGKVLDGIIMLVQERARAKGLQLVLELDAAVPRVLQGDPLRLRQVLLNLVDNAIKFTSAGEVTLAVRLLEQHEGEAFLHFEVVDTGTGISAEQLARLFQSFQQADTSVTRKYGGTGLGLVISKRLVGLMGGDLQVESEPDRGSRFWFELWLGQSADQEMEAVVEGGEEGVLRGKRVLLVENNLFNQQVAREFLEHAGMVVVVANNGAEALDLLRFERFDAVLMDLQMPVMDGFEATRQIRANPQWEKMPVIAMTANVLEEERARCQAAGMDDFVGKPVHPELLFRVLRHRLAPAGGAEAASAPVKAAWNGREKEKLQMVPETLLDTTRLEGMVGENQARVREFLYKFLAATEADMDQVDDALGRQDMAALKALGHHIKSPAAMVGAMRFSELCRELETNQEGIERARALVLQMHLMLDRIDEQIRKRFP